MAAGPELSVAATKTFVAALAALLRLVAAWSERCRARLRPSTGCRTGSPPRRRSTGAPRSTLLAASDSLITIGRGPTLAIAREAALKLKETCDLHAEAFSGAEFLHGPVALVSTRYPILMFMPTDAGGRRACARSPPISASKGARVFVAAAGCGPGRCRRSRPIIPRPTRSA